MADIYFPYFSSPKNPTKITSEDTLLRSPMEAGYTLLRKRYTRTRKTYDFSWDFGEDEAFEFINFYDTTLNGGSLDFWIDITIGQTRINKKVYFAKVPEIMYNGIGTWEITCSFMEV